MDREFTDEQLKDMKEIKDFIVSKGEKGNPPDYYILIEAAEILNVKVWELEERPDRDEWIRRALQYKSADPLNLALLRLFESRQLMADETKKKDIKPPIMTVIK